MVEKGFRRAWFLVVAAVGIAGIGVVAGFNYVVDDALLFSPDASLERAAREVVSGKLIGGLANFDRRLFQEHLITSMDRRVDVMSVGFSRTIQLRRCQLHLPEGTVYLNNSVTSGSMPDYLAIVQLYRAKKGYIPKTVILGIEPWTFNESWKEENWRSIASHYQDMLAAIGQSEQRVLNPIPPKYMELVDLEYTLNNFSVVKRRFTDTGMNGTIAFLREKARKSAQNVDYYIAPNTDVDDYVVGTDGSLHYPRSVRYPTPEYVQGKAIGYANTENSIVDWNSIENKAVFEAFVRFLKSQGTEVVLLLNPYHPVAYETLVNDARYRLLPELERYVRAFAARERLQVVGSYDPGVFGFENMDFQDAMHGQPWVLERIFQDFRPAGVNVPPSRSNPPPPTASAHCSG